MQDATETVGILVVQDSHYDSVYPAYAATPHGANVQMR